MQKFLTDANKASFDLIEPIKVRHAELEALMKVVAAIVLVSFSAVAIGSLSSEAQAGRMSQSMSNPSAKVKGPKCVDSTGACAHKKRKRAAY